MKLNALILVLTLSFTSMSLGNGHTAPQRLNAQINQIVAMPVNLRSTPEQVESQRAAIRARLVALRDALAQEINLVDPPDRELPETPQLSNLRFRLYEIENLWGPVFKAASDPQVCEEERWSVEMDGRIGESEDSIKPAYRRVLGVLAKICPR